MRKVRFYKKARDIEAQPHIIYDHSIENIEERRSKAILFPTATHCANYLGISKASHLQYYTSKEAIINKRTFKHKQSGKVYSIRRICSEKYRILMAERQRLTYNINQ